ncbi:hypothetical protein AAG570_012190 [Ranatra chinensis]|uniref:Uncharacterized protein n=1 Tax=Ranatra chinensis TaxID=642074 RepID=A0ABD0Z6E7_9HEMI
MASKRRNIRLGWAIVADGESEGGRGEAVTLRGHHRDPHWANHARDSPNPPPYLSPETKQKEAESGVGATAKWRTTTAALEFLPGLPDGPTPPYPQNPGGVMG